MIYYRQCLIQKEIIDDNGKYGTRIVKTCFIPEKYAIKDHYVKIKDKDKWDNGWQVIEIGTRLVEAALPDHHEDRKGFASLDKNEK